MKTTPNILACLSIVAVCMTVFAVPTEAVVDLGGSYVSIPGYCGQVRAQPDGQNQHSDSEFTIIVRLMSTNGISVANYPRQYIVLSGGGNLHDCRTLASFLDAFAIADANTDENGYTTFTASTPFQCGGQLSPGNDFAVMVNNNGGYMYNWAVLGTGSGLDIRTADFDGDGAVTVSDTAIFVAAINGPYDWRVDLNFDLVVNISDLPLYIQAIGASCP